MKDDVIPLKETQESSNSVKKKVQKDHHEKRIPGYQTAESIKNLL